VQVSLLGFADWSLADSVDVVNFIETKRQKDREKKKTERKKRQREKKDRETKRQKEIKIRRFFLTSELCRYHRSAISPLGFADWSLADAVNDVNFMETQKQKRQSDRETKRQRNKETERQKHIRGFPYFGVVQVSPSGFADW
jgi:hypothetical protein